jgi:hypothetical protein
MPRSRLDAQAGDGPPPPPQIGFWVLKSAGPSGGPRDGITSAYLEFPFFDFRFAGFRLTGTVNASASVNCDRGQTFDRLPQYPSPQRYCHAIPTAVSSLPVRVVMPVLAESLREFCRSIGKATVKPARVIASRYHF